MWISIWCSKRRLCILIIRTTSWKNKSFSGDKVASLEVRRVRFSWARPETFTISFDHRLRTIDAACRSKSQRLTTPTEPRSTGSHVSKIPFKNDQSGFKACSHSPLITGSQKVLRWWTMSILTLEILMQRWSHLRNGSRSRLQMQKHLSRIWRLDICQRRTLQLRSARCGALAIQWHSVRLRKKTLLQLAISKMDFTFCSFKVLQAVCHWNPRTITSGSWMASCE